MSRVQNISIENTGILKPHIHMGERDLIAARLRELQDDVLGGRMSKDMAADCGVEPPDWSNYIAIDPKAPVQIPAMAAYFLGKAHKVPMEWIYGGDVDKVDDPNLRRKLVAADQRARAWLAAHTTPPKTPPKRRTAHIALIIALGSALAWGWPSGAGRANHANHAPTSVVGDCSFSTRSCFHYSVLSP